MVKTTNELVKSSIEFYENKIITNNETIALSKEVANAEAPLLELDNEFYRKEIQRIKSEAVKFSPAPQPVVLTTEKLEARLRCIRMATSIKVAVEDMRAQRDKFIVEERSEADQLKKGARVFIKNRCRDIASVIRKDYNEYFESNYGTIVNVVFGGEMFGYDASTLMVFVNPEKTLSNNPVQLSEMFDMEKDYSDVFSGNAKLEGLIDETYKEFKFFGSCVTLYETLPVIIYTTSIIKKNNEKGGE